MEVGAENMKKEHNVIKCVLKKKNERTSRPHPALLAAIFEDCAAPLKGLELESL